MQPATEHGIALDAVRVAVPRLAALASEVLGDLVQMSVDSHGEARLLASSVREGEYALKMDRGVQTPAHGAARRS